MAASTPAEAEITDMQELQLHQQQLQQTVLALRGAMEQLKADADAREAALRAAHEAEKRLLHEAINALREQLEGNQADAQAALQQCRAQAAEEMRQLQQGLIRQRELLDQLQLLQQQQLGSTLQ